jgi:hypothetical protein
MKAPGRKSRPLRLTREQGARRYEERVDRGLTEATRQAMADQDNQEDIAWEQVKADLEL